MKITGFSQLDTGYTRAIANRTKAEAMPSSEKTSTVGIGNTKNAATVKPFSAVALDARAALDAGYQRLGRTADFETPGAQLSDVVGYKDLDRRTLYAIASNQSGIFSQQEMDVARFFMGKQIEAVSVAADPTRTNPAAIYKATIDFLDNVSPEEKASLDWAQARGANQWGYEHHMRARGLVPENVNTGNPYVELFRRAYDELAATGDASQDVRNMPSFLKGVELWHLHNDDREPFSFTL